MNERNIAILLATYNGDEYLKEQINSIISQTYKDWTLYIQDDGSTDNTLAIIDGYTQQHSNIQFLGQTKGLGAKGNFFSMLQQVNSKYYMFCDQDDVWVEDKILVEMERMEVEEHRHPNKPVLVFTDLLVVDANLQTIAESFFTYAGIYPQFLTTFGELGASNLVTGCTMLINHVVKDVASRHSASTATMHDAWLALCTAKAHGILSCITTPLVLYRQHSSNALGASDIGRLTLRYRLGNIKKNYLLNKQHHDMLQSLCYGSWLRLIYHRLRYKLRVALSK
jgi:glycosyltransferase involved in cell wall biosynthesis